MSVPPRIHPFLQSLVDYAGLFPPASLDMADAVAEYAAHLDGEDAQMLGRFICPVDRLDELHPFSERFAGGRPFRLTLLVRGGDRPAEAVARALTTGGRFASSFGGEARIESVETTLATPTGGLALRSTLCSTADAAAPRPVFVEIPVAREPDAAAVMLAEFAPARRSGRSSLGAKMRCGGTQAEDYPSTDAVASFLYHCVMDGVPFKATAGLHHPVRGHPSDEGPPMHGFLNVFGAAVLGATRGLSEAEIERIVSETDADAFSLADGQFVWRGVAAPLPAVQAVRTGLAHAFGSCSFLEPTDDLRALGWLRSYP